MMTNGLKEKRKTLRVSYTTVSLKLWSCNLSVIITMIMMMPENNECYVLSIYM